MTAGVRGINVYGKDIIWVDYEGCKTSDQMIQVFDDAINFLIKRNESSLVLTNFKDTFITSPFLRHVEHEAPRVAHLIKRRVFVGMNMPKKMILKGIYQSPNLDHLAFDSEQEAIEFLIKS